VVWIHRSGLPETPLRFFKASRFHEHIAEVFQIETGLDSGDALELYADHTINDLSQDALCLLISSGVCQYIRLKSTAPQIAQGQKWQKPERLIISTLSDEMIGVACQCKSPSHQKERYENEP
jgi:hypothetical protein